MHKNVVVLVVALLLVSFVSPFSYLPNPLGIAYLFRGSYSYDPRLQFLVNRFALLRADAEVALRANLDRLIGTTGLDPLDPNHPLRSYQFERVVYEPAGWAYGQVRMEYADGSSRVYRIPVVQPEQAQGRPGGWAYTGLDRYFAPHRELPHLPLAGLDAPIRFGPARRLPLPDEAHQLGTDLLFGWYTSSRPEGDEPIWASDGTAFLLGTESDPRSGRLARELWLVPLDGHDRILLGTNAEHYDWSDDGQRIVFLRRESWTSPLQVPPRPGWEVVVVDRAGDNERVVAHTSTDQVSRPRLIGEAVWYLAEGVLWRARLPSGPAERVRDLPGLRTDRRDLPLAFTPDGRRLAYRCGDALCLIDVDGQHLVRVDLGAPPLPAATPMPRPTGPPPPNATPVLTQSQMAPPPPPNGPRPTAVAADAFADRQFRPASDRADFYRLMFAWSPTGDRLAAVASDLGAAAMPTLWIVDRDGNVARAAAVGPNGATRAPQWMPDGRWFFLNTFPEAGRRLVIVRVDDGRTLDLSQPRWDTFASLAPDGQRLLLWNGRGGFWTADLVRGTK